MLSVATGFTAREAAKFTPVVVDGVTFTALVLVIACGSAGAEIAGGTGTRLSLTPPGSSNSIGAGAGIGVEVEVDVEVDVEVEVEVKAVAAEAGMIGFSAVSAEGVAGVCNVVITMAGGIVDSAANGICPGNAVSGWGVPGKAARERIAGACPTGN